MLTIRLGCGETITEELSLPLSVSGMRAVEEIRESGKKQNMKVTIRSCESSVLVLPSCINGMEYNMRTQNELEFLVSRLEHLTGMEQDILSVALKLEEPGTLKEIINLSYNLDRYELLTDTCNDGAMSAELLARGKNVIIPEELYPFLDYERVRDSYVAAYPGDVCPQGFVIKREGGDFTEVYQEHLPDPGDEKDALFLLRLCRMSNGKPLSYSIALPTEKEKLDMAKTALKIKDFSECNMSQYGGRNDGLRHYIPVGGGIEELNHFAKSLKEKLMDSGKESLSYLMAALEAECPRNIEEALKVVDNLNRYNTLPGIRTAGDYARYAVQKESSVTASS